MWSEKEQESAGYDQSAIATEAWAPAVFPRSTRLTVTLAGRPTPSQTAKRSTTLSVGPTVFLFSVTALSFFISQKCKDVFWSASAHTQWSVIYCCCFSFLFIVLRSLHGSHSPCFLREGADCIQVIQSSHIRCHLWWTRLCRNRFYSSSQTQRVDTSAHTSMETFIATYKVVCFVQITWGGGTNMTTTVDRSDRFPYSFTKLRNFFGQLSHGASRDHEHFRQFMK